MAEVDARPLRASHRVQTGQQTAANLIHVVQMRHVEIHPPVTLVEETADALAQISRLIPQVKSPAGITTIEPRR